jgi:hypothetical protein
LLQEVYEVIVVANQPARQYKHESCQLNDPDYYGFRIAETEENNDNYDEQQ